MNIKQFLLLILFAYSLYSCKPNTVYIGDDDQSGPVTYKVVKRSPLFNETNTTFTLDSFKKQLFITLQIKEKNKISFPVLPETKDTLFKTAFNFDFYCNGKLIESDYNQFKNQDWSVDTTVNAFHLSISTDTVSLKEGATINLQIPFYAFNRLKKGLQHLELNISQSVFTTEGRRVTKDGSYEDVHLYANKQIFDARLQFDLMIPPVYKSVLYGYGLQLRNDSTFSPAGMDNTIWKSSYPDIYWVVYYPTDVFYTQTDYEVSTDRYVGRDTFNLYHYYSDDSLGFGVYDHDGLSRDDGMGFWTGSIEALAKHKISRIRFDYIKSFDIKVERKGVIN